MRLNNNRYDRATRQYRTVQTIPQSKRLKSFVIVLFVMMMIATVAYFVSERFQSSYKTALNQLKTDSAALSTTQSQNYRSTLAEIDVLIEEKEAINVLVVGLSNSNLRTTSGHDLSLLNLYTLNPTGKDASTIISPEVTMNTLSFTQIYNQKGTQGVMTQLQELFKTPIDAVIEIHLGLMRPIIDVLGTLNVVSRINGHALNTELIANQRVTLSSREAMHYISSDHANHNILEKALKQRDIIEAIMLKLSHLEQKLNGAKLNAPLKNAVRMTLDYATIAQLIQANYIAGNMRFEQYQVQSQANSVTLNASESSNIDEAVYEAIREFLSSSISERER